MLRISPFSSTKSNLNYTEENFSQEKAKSPQTLNKRIKVVISFFALITFLIIGRLFFWQVWSSDALGNVARAQYVRGKNINAHRGLILASDGYPLVTTRTAWTLSAEPRKFNKDARSIAISLSRIILPKENREATGSAVFVNSEEERIYRLIIRENARWVLLREKLDEWQKEEIEKLGIEGLSLTVDQARLYPEASMAANILGFVGKNEEGVDKGYFGLEGFYDISLSGKGGYVRGEKDARGNQIPFGAFSEVEVLDGLDLETYIDRSIQFTIERKIKEGVEKYGAKSGVIIVMRPTGEVLGMASFPSYDARSYRSFDSTLFKNPAVADSFEPGSVFKALIMAAALDAGVVQRDTKCDACSGPVFIDKYTIKTYNEVYYPDTTMEDVILHSDNTGMVFVARKLGIDRLWDYLQSFGIGQLTGVDLQEEANPGLRDKENWNEVDLATSSFGQGIALTAIQFIRGFASIANGGIVPDVRIVKKLIGEGSEQNIHAKSGRRVISEEAARKMTDMMVRSVDQGEGVIKWSRPEGFKKAGKSATAQVPEGGKYTERTIASFAGFAPADKPEFVMLVSLKEPTANPWGANTAAPIWFSVVKDLIPYFGIQPE